MIGPKKIIMQVSFFYMLGKSNYGPSITKVHVQLHKRILYA